MGDGIVVSGRLRLAYRVRPSYRMSRLLGSRPLSTGGRGIGSEAPRATLPSVPWRDLPLQQLAHFCLVPRKTVYCPINADLGHHPRSAVLLATQ
jgi:hypothetical protein